MRFKLYWIFLVLAIISLLLGAYNTFNFRWETEIDAPVIGTFVTFYCYGFGSLLLATSLTYLILIPRTVKFKAMFLSSTVLFGTLEPTVGKAVAKRIVIFHGFLFIAFVFLCIFVLPYAFNSYEKHELLNNATTKEIEISETGTNQKGFPIAIITYDFNGVTYTKELFLKNHKKGEKVLLRFSTKRPLLAGWNDDFK